MRLVRYLNFFIMYYRYHALCLLLLLLCIALASSSVQFHIENKNYDGLNIDSSYFLLILIPTAPNEAEKRNQARQTWLKFDDVLSNWDDVRHCKVIHLFIIGVRQTVGEEHIKLLREKDKYEDILLLSSDDSYRSLSTKMLKAYSQVSGVDYKFLLKTDSDAFVNVPALLRRLQHNDVQERLIYLGYFVGGAPVYRTGKWADPEWNDCDTYLPYAQGGGYVISKEAIGFIGSNADKLRIFPIEDVSVGFWLSPLNVKRIHDIRFNTGESSRGCQNSFIVSHPHTQNEIKTMYKAFLETKGEHICQNENKFGATYQYQWDDLPFRCCNLFVKES